MADNRPIGVFDSGLGGLTVTKEIIKLLPNEDIVYFGDTGRVPYGTKGPETIKKYALDDEKFLLSKNVKLIVAACGTVSSVASDTAENLPVPFIEVISNSVLSAIKATKNKKIGVLATGATIKSGKHKSLILEKLPNATVIEVSGTLLVPIVEEGFIEDGNPILKEAVKIYTKKFKEENVDTIILGCTHFPLVCDAIKKEMGENVTLINMGETAAKATKEKLEELGILNPSGGKHKFYVSDKGATFEKTASVLLGENVDSSNVETVDINKI